MLGHIPMLEDTLKQILEQADEDRRNAALAAAALAAAQAGTGGAPILVTGANAMAYLAAGEAGIRSAQMQTTAQRFGPVIGGAVNLTALIAGIGFLWLVISGGSAQLFKYYIGGVNFIFLHGFILAAMLNMAYDVYLSLCLSLVIGAYYGWRSFTLPATGWPLANVWFAMVSLLFFRVVPAIGPLLFVNWIPLLGSIFGFYFFILAASIGIAYGVTYEAQGANKLTVNAVVVATGSTLIAMGVFNVLFECVLGKPAGYDYLKFLSVPGAVSLSKGVDAVLTALFLVLAVAGTVINRIRYQQFGIDAMQFAPSEKEPAEFEYT